MLANDAMNRLIRSATDHRQPEDERGAEPMTGDDTTEQSARNPSMNELMRAERDWRGQTTAYGSRLRRSRGA